MTITDDSNTRKNIPLARGVLDYFPAALAEVARLSQAGNDKHNPGEELHHARDKSNDHADCILRHLTDRGSMDTDGFLHDVKVAWRALAMLQEALEARGAAFARGAQADADYLEDLFDLRTIHERRGEPTRSLSLEDLLDSKVDVSYDTSIPEAFDPGITIAVDDYGRFVGEALDPITLNDEELADWRLCDAVDALDGFGDVDSLDLRRDSFPGETEPAWTSIANCISNRIAGDTIEAKAFKNPYYGHDPELVRGKCDNIICECILKVDDECIVEDDGSLFCSLTCWRA